MNTTMESKPHVVVIPFMAQGHVMPLMKLSYRLVDQGFRVTFVNTEHIHAKLMDSLGDQGNELSDSIQMVAIPDGLTPEVRNSPLLSLLSSVDTLQKEFEKLIRKIMDSSKSEKIACVIADETLAWASEVSMRIGIRAASFFPAPAAVKALWFNIPKLIEMGVIDDNGTVKNDETMMLSPTMPTIITSHIVWHLNDSRHLEKDFFQVMLKNEQISQSADWVLCNSSDQLEQAAISSVPNLLPIGPLLANNQIGNLWPEDSTCMSWLNQQATSSVIYIAFGSIATLNQRQFHELALGLELLERPFLWVVRTDEINGSTTTFPDGFQDRIAHIGKIVAWAPQQKVLAHPSIACFFSHCGWNSTMDGVSMGVPFISWPSFCDQFTNGTYITDVWKVGLGLNPDEDGIISRDEIRRKVDQLLEDKEIRQNVLKLKKMVMTSIGIGGSSFENFKKFVEELKR